MSNPTHDKAWHTDAVLFVEMELEVERAVRELWEAQIRLDNFKNELARLKERLAETVGGNIQTKAFLVKVNEAHWTVLVEYQGLEGKSTRVRAIKVEGGE